MVILVLSSSISDNKNKV